MGGGRGAAPSARQHPGLGHPSRSPLTPAFSSHPRVYTQACAALGLDPPEGALGAPFGGPPVKAGLLPTRRQLSRLWRPWYTGSGSTDVCVFIRILRTNKCQGKSEGKRFHPPPALNDIIASKSGCLTHTLLLTWGGGRPLRPTISVLTAGAGGGDTPVSSCPSNVPGLKKSQVSPLLQPFFCVTPAKPLSTRLSICCGPGNRGPMGHDLAPPSRDGCRQACEAGGGWS